MGFLKRVFGHFSKTQEEKKASAIVDQLVEHCLGDACPVRHMLDSGKFPDSWVERYLDLLEEAVRCWREQSNWPKELVTSIHFSSWYLDHRYKVWCLSHNSSNRTTEGQLATIRNRSELFLLAGLPELQKKSFWKRYW